MAPFLLGKLKMVYLLFVAGALIEILGITISVIGVGQLVGMNLIIILMAVAFDVGKIATVSSLQRNWHSMNVAMKSYGILAIIVTMLITSFGAASYLSSSLQAGLVNVGTIDAKLNLLTREQERLQARKQQIDDQIAAIPLDAPTRLRNSITSNLQQEQEATTLRLTELSQQIPILQVEKLEKGGKSSALISLSESLGIEINSLIKYLVFLIIFVFDPFAIYLIMSGNHMLNSIKNTSIPERQPENVGTSTHEEVENKKSEPISSIQQEDEIVSEISPVLTPVEVPSILEGVSVNGDLFANDMMQPSRVAEQYKTKPFHQQVKGIEL